MELGFGAGNPSFQECPWPLAFLGLTVFSSVFRKKKKKNFACISLEVAVRIKQDSGCCRALYMLKDSQGGGKTNIPVPIRFGGT